MSMCCPWQREQNGRRTQREQESAEARQEEPKVLEAKHRHAAGGVGLAPLTIRYR